MIVLQSVNIPKYFLPTIHDYFSNRVMMYDSNEGTNNIKLTGIFQKDRSTWTTIMKRDL